ASSRSRSARRKTTSCRGRITSPSVCSVASKTSPRILRSSAGSDWLVMTQSRSSCSVICSPVALGSPPSSRTTTFVELDSSQMTGRMMLANRSSGGPTASALVDARCSASRFGTSSPQHQREIGDEQRHHDERDVVGGRLRQPERDERGRDGGRDRRGAVGGREEPGHRDTHLDRGEEPVRVARDGGYARTPGALLL